MSSASGSFGYSNELVPAAHCCGNARLSSTHFAHIAARKGEQARYRGTRRNLFDLRRAATIQNLEGLQRMMRAAA